MSRFKDKVALVTGAASNPGLGRAIAQLLAREGGKVVVTDVDEAGIADCEAAIRAAGGSAVGWRQDVTSEDDWKTTIDRCTGTFGRLDVLVNNAGIAVLRPVASMTLEEYELQMKVNMTSVFLGTHYALPAMQAAGGGSIVNISSVAGLVGIPFTGAYAASKGGIRLFSKTVAMEHASEKIRCNSVHPGVIWTKIQEVAMRDNPDGYTSINKSIPVGRMGRPDEVAQCVLFLASDESSYVTGTELVVDGGLTAQ
jgi:NAD(P)-dependent dehydrogenase (short-subunit alcohol dehydrogenase family)